jgi:hypothetical protein
LFFLSCERLMTILKRGAGGDEEAGDDEVEEEGVPE